MPTILGANSVRDTGYNVDNSLRFDDASSDYLSHSPSSASNRRTWTLSFWTKRSNLGKSGLFGGWTDGNYQSGFASMIYFNSSDELEIDHDIAGADYNFKTDRKFRDIGSWYHIVIAVDTTQSTETNRQKIYVNGEGPVDLTETALGFPAQNFDTFFNNELTIVSSYAYEGGSGTVDEYSGYMCEVAMIDGSQLDATSFGEFDSDSPKIWKPKDFKDDVTFGTNGFYLEFKQSGTSQNSSGMGADTSGNDNHFAVNNLTSIDQTTDTCTNNFITLNPLILETNRTDSQTYSQGNTISIPNSHDSYNTTSSTIGLKGAGKWYWEAQIVWNGTASNAYYPRTIGFVTHDYAYSASYLDQDEESWAIIYQAGGGPGWRIGHANSESNISGATAMADGDTMIFALDLDNGKFYAGRNGTFYTSGDPTSGATGTGALATLDSTDLSKFLFPAVTNASNATYYKFNFGNPAYSISSGNSDANGFGNFEYSVPSGYFAICSKNLAEFG